MMGFVDAGPFLRGSAEWEVDKAYGLCERYTPGNCNREWFETESPQRTITLAGYWLDITEVTNAQYDKCVAVGACAPPNLARCLIWDAEAGEWSPMAPHENRARFAKPEQPVVCVNWHEATAYCQWAGKRLPSEAEWEKAARGTKAQTFPWGESDPSCDRANMYNQEAGGFGCGRDETLPVGSFAESPSPFGMLDMGGNAFEWVQDFDDPQYYIHSPAENPINLDAPTQTSEEEGVAVTVPSDVRGIRGGAWNADAMLLRGANRGGFAEAGRTVYTGFRCAMAP
jgi:formylglycine-generating enzyme required for sulfatase activity